MKVLISRIPPFQAGQHPAINSAHTPEPPRAPFKLLGPVCDGYINNIVIHTRQWPAPLRHNNERVCKAWFSIFINRGSLSIMNISYYVVVIVSEMEKKVLKWMAHMKFNIVISFALYDDISACSTYQVFPPFITFNVVFSSFIERHLASNLMKRSLLSTPNAWLSNKEVRIAKHLEFYTVRQCWSNSRKDFPVYYCKKQGLLYTSHFIIQMRACSVSARAYSEIIKRWTHSSGWPANWFSDEITKKTLWPFSHNSSSSFRRAYWKEKVLLI